MTPFCSSSDNISRVLRTIKDETLSDVSARSSLIYLNICLNDKKAKGLQISRHNILHKLLKQVFHNIKISSTIFLKYFSLHQRQLKIQFVCINMQVCVGF